LKPYFIYQYLPYWHCRVVNVGRLLTFLRTIHKCEGRIVSSIDRSTKDQPSCSSFYRAVIRMTVVCLFSCVCVCLRVFRTPRFRLLTHIDSTHFGGWPRKPPLVTIVVATDSPNRPYLHRFASRDRLLVRVSTSNIFFLCLVLDL